MDECIWQDSCCFFKLSTIQLCSRVVLGSIFNICHLRKEHKSKMYQGHSILHLRVRGFPFENTADRCGGFSRWRCHEYLKHFLAGLRLTPRQSLFPEHKAGISHSRLESSPGSQRLANDEILRGQKRRPAALAFKTRLRSAKPHTL